MLTKTHPLVIWGIYLPVITYFLYYSNKWQSHSSRRLSEIESESQLEIALLKRQIGEFENLKHVASEFEERGSSYAEQREQSNQQTDVVVQQD